MTNKMTNLMTDLETMGNGNDAAIIAIGACFFDPVTGEIGDTFYAPVDLGSSIEAGLKMDPSTVTWWMKQDEDAREIFHQKARPIQRVLKDFVHFANQISIKELKVWGNGSSFDNVILKNAFAACDLHVPWKFWNDRDVRTMVDVGRLILGIDPKRDMPFEGVRHNALADAQHQAYYVSRIYRGLKSPV